jgi:hypothetical protein
LPIRFARNRKVDLDLRNAVGDPELRSYYVARPAPIPISNFFHSGKPLAPDGYETCAVNIDTIINYEIMWNCERV